MTELDKMSYINSHQRKHERKITLDDRLKMVDSMVKENIITTQQGENMKVEIERLFG